MSRPEREPVRRSHPRKVVAVALAATAVLLLIMALLVFDRDAVSGPPFADAETAAVAQAQAFAKVPWMEYRAMFSGEPRMGTLGVGASQFDDAEWEERYRFSVGYGSDMEIESCTTSEPHTADCVAIVHNEVLRRLGEPATLATLTVSLSPDGLIDSVVMTESTNNHYERWRAWAMRNLDLESPWSDPDTRISADPEKEAARAVAAIARFMAEEQE